MKIKNGYFRIYYHGKEHGYWENVYPQTEEEEETILKAYEKCRMQGVLRVESPEAIGFYETFTQSGECPEVLLKEDKIMNLVIELRTLTQVDDW